jgi:hypothetical protein
MTENNKTGSETTVTVTLPQNYKEAALLISRFLGYSSFDDFVSEAVKQNIDMQVDGGGDLRIGPDIDLRKNLHLQPLQQEG